MKRLIILLVMLLPLSAMAQTPTFESLISEYSSKDGCTTINISNAMLRSMEVNIDAEYMQVISVENEALVSSFRTQAQEVLKGFDVIMSVNSKGKSVEIRQSSNAEGVVVDIFVMACRSDECVLMRVKGKNLELNNISSLMNTL